MNRYADLPGWVWIAASVLFLVFATQLWALADEFPAKSGKKPWTDEQLTNGYVRAEDTTTFLFDASVYEVKPKRVVVTGPFRQWSQDMADSDWQLARSDDHPSVWVLSIKNAEQRGLGPSTPFKYRIDEGRWMDPPIDATNRKGGDLVHRPGEKRKRLRAEIMADGTIEVEFEGLPDDDSDDPSEFTLTGPDGKEISIRGLTATDSDDRFRLTVDESLDPRRVYYLQLDAHHLRSRCRRDGWFRTLGSTKTLGAELSPDGMQTTFRLFAPRCTDVKLYLYDDAEDQSAKATLSMSRDQDGVWEAVADQTVHAGDHHGLYYDFTVHGPSDPGNYFYETHPVHVSDPYARVSVDSFGKSRVWKPTRPATPLKNGRPAMEEVIAYEVHVEDFTNQLPIQATKKGTFSGMVTPGLTNRNGEPIGFDHLVSLGINVVHLMPIQEFLHYPDDVWQQAFKDDPYMKAAGVDRTNYQWGYRTTHAFAIETRYRTKGTDHGDQRDQFRDLVQAFHDRDIAVIIDLVPNHTGENMDGRHELFNFNAIDLPYYYRTDDELNHIGPFGNEVKTEDRPMVRRWLIDQCRHLMQEFGIDGFRIDLAGQVDKQSLLALRRELPPDTIIYGEPWIAPTDPDVAQDPRYGWYKKDAPITYFQDSARNAMKGPVSNPENKRTDRGYAGGNPKERSNIQLTLTNGFDDEVHPNRGINYLDIHDNWALADRFALNDWNGLRGVDEPRYRIAAGLLMTSLGPVVLHGGVEIMRSKGAAPLREVKKNLPDGPLVFHGKNDTYNMRSANEFIWDNVGKSRAAGLSDAELGVGDFAGMMNYWKGLIEFRKGRAGRVFRVGRQPPKDYYRWILPDDEHLLGYIVDDTVLVLVNVSDQAGTFGGIEVDPTQWRWISDGSKVDLDKGLGKAGWKADASGGMQIRVPPTSLQIYVKR